MIGQRPYGDGSLFQRSSDGLWVARLETGRDGDGMRRRWQCAGRSRTVVLAALRQARIDQATSAVPVPQGLTVAGWLRRWLEDVARPTVRPSTFRDYATTVRRHLIPSLGSTRLTRLTPGDVRAMHQHVSSQVSVSAANKAHRVLRAALSDAEREGLVGRNAARLVRTPTLASPRSALSRRRRPADPGRIPDRTAGLPVARRTAHRRPARRTARLEVGPGQPRRRHRRPRLAASGPGLPARLPPPINRPRMRKTRAGSCPGRELDVPAAFEHTPLRGRCA